jgi:hypothetical protein
MPQACAQGDARVGRVEPYLGTASEGARGRVAVAAAVEVVDLFGGSSVSRRVADTHQPADHRACRLRSSRRSLGRGRRSHGVGGLLEVTSDSATPTSCGARLSSRPGHRRTATRVSYRTRARRARWLSTPAARARARQSVTAALTQWQPRLVEQQHTFKPRKCVQASWPEVL